MSTDGFLEESAKALRSAQEEIDLGRSRSYSTYDERFKQNLQVAEGFARLAAISQGLNPWVRSPEKDNQDA